MNFSDLHLITPILKALTKLGIHTPTQIQTQAIPEILQDKDVLWLAQTGSWKTLSFMLPILHKIYDQRKKSWYTEWKIDRKIQALIVTPTRELAIQIWSESKLYCTNTNIQQTVIYGWVNQFHQEKKINKWIDVLIATPGRLLDLIKQWIISLKDVQYFVLDEADKMLNMWFINDIIEIITYLPLKRQNLLFSATMPKKIEELSDNILVNPVKIEVHSNSSTVDTIQQYMYNIEDENKSELLIDILNKNNYESVIVFVKTKDRTELVLHDLLDKWFRVDHIHRNRSQNARQRALKKLKNREIQILIATDILSRWIDIDGISCVINYDLPQENETYVHRIWRTARAGKDWIAISFVVSAQKEKMDKIMELTWSEIKQIKNTN